MDKIASHAKSLLAGLIAFVGSVATGYSDEIMRIAEWWAAGSAGLVALGVVYGVKNAGYVRLPHGGAVRPINNEPL